MNINKPNTFKEAEVISDNKIINLVLGFLGVFLISCFFESIIQFIAVFISLINKTSINEILTIFEDSNALSELIYGNNALLLIMLFSTICSIIVPILYCVKIEKRPISSMGIIKNNAFKTYFIGLIVGFLMISSVVLLEILTGNLEFNGLNNITLYLIVMIVLLFIGFAVQSASEEVMMRGYFLTSMGAKNKVCTAIFLSAVIFSLIHIGNDGFSIIPFINITLIGIFFALYYICFDNIWGVSAVHGMWNFAQGNIYGISVSGITMKNSIFKTTQVGNELFNGGSFGAEGGIITTAIIVISLIILLCYMKKKGKILD